MTRRMVRAVSNGHADVLGHCTGRLVAGNRGIRPESKFDAEAVFTACRDHGTAVEINSRPERRDPPTRLLSLALEIGCVFSIDTDAHAPGQLDFLGYGAQRALDAGVPVDRIVNTWPADELLEWTGVSRVSAASRGRGRGRQHGWRQGGIAVALAHSVDRGIVDGQRLALAEGQHQLLGAAAVDARHREADQRQSALRDQRRRRRDQLPGGGQDAAASTRWPTARCATGWPG